MDVFLSIILKGILIGLCISVPLGPVGMLCVQRTLHRGRSHGLVTGLGASTSDLFYIIISLFFLSFVIDFVNKNQFVIQFAGSLLVCAFGVFIFRNNPSVQPKPSEKPNSSLLKDYASSLALTLSNPLILFVLIALFARFNFLSDQVHPLQIVAGLLAILGGATAWWAVLTVVVSRFRHKCRLRELKIINMITGIVIILIGIIGIFVSLW
ncbi:MAG: LysE family transporter [Prevotellaceae bacterium]|jgi:threonine/homoserine/homoserine lactone efflux protein|nr:LysE family transporter [Prevotellaceae bacterium]